MQLHRTDFTQSIKYKLAISDSIYVRPVMQLGMDRW